VKPSTTDTKKADPRWGIILAGAGVSVFVLILYLRTLAPTVLPYGRPDLLDVPMLQMQVCVLGMTHPTGYPTYLMLSHLFTYLPFGDCAYRANLASAAYAALAVAALFAAAYQLSRQVVASAAAALAFGLGTTLWSQAVMAEVYTLNALLVAITILALLVWHERRRDRYLLLCAFLVGFGMTNHLTSGLLLPGSLLFVGLVDWRKLTNVRLVLKAAVLFLLGLTPYLYLPIRATTAPFKANDPTTFERFWYVVSGGNLRGGFFAFGPTELPGRLLFYLGFLVENFHWGLLAVAVIGIVYLAMRDRAVAGFLGFLFCGWAFYSIENDIPDVDLYFIPTYLVLSLAMAVGFAFVLSEVEKQSSRLKGVPKGLIVGVLSAAMLILPLLGAGQAYASNDRSGDYRGRQILDDVAESAKPNATILHHRSNLWYMVLVEKRRQDLTLVDPFSHNRNIGYADIVWPADLDLAASNRHYGTDDFSGVTAAEKAAKKGPVYILSQIDVDPSGLYKAGWRTVHVKGALYQLIPPQGEGSR
jgi:Protein of unknown function (DUF2723)